MVSEKLDNDMTKKQQQKIPAHQSGSLFHALQCTSQFKVDKKKNPQNQTRIIKVMEENKAELF